MREATFTVSPHMSKMNFFLPITPATTGPVPMPMRSSMFSPLRCRYSCTRSSISSAMLATASA